MASARRAAHLLLPPGVVLLSLFSGPHSWFKGEELLPLGQEGWVMAIGLFGVSLGGTKISILCVIAIVEKKKKTKTPVLVQY